MFNDYSSLCRAKYYTAELTNCWSTEIFNEKFLAKTNSKITKETHDRVHIQKTTQDK